MSIYLVKGLFHFRGHAPGKTFMATLDEDEELRAIKRGNIEVLARGSFELDESKIRKPKG